MKRTMVLVALSSALILAMLFSPIPHAKADINDARWQGGYTYPRDPYWSVNWLDAFLEGSTAVLMVEVYNNHNYDLNVSGVSVLMDWAASNASSNECSSDSPLVMPRYTYHWFTVTVDVPLVTVASNLVDHRYRVFVDQVNATTGPKGVTSFDVNAYSGFYIYSGAQKEATRLWNELTALDTMVFWSWDSVEARNMWYDGLAEWDLGEFDHDNADFASAATRYQDALDMMSEAVAIEGDYDKELQDYNRNDSRMWDDLYIREEEAYIAESNARANATEMMAEGELSQAQALATQALGWIVFGIGFLVIGIAACIWAYKRPIHTT